MTGTSIHPPFNYADTKVWKAIEALPRIPGVYEITAALPIEVHEVCPHTTFPTRIVLEVNVTGARNPGTGLARQLAEQGHEISYRVKAYPQGYDTTWIEKYHLLYPNPAFGNAVCAAVKDKYPFLMAEWSEQGAQGCDFCDFDVTVDHRVNQIRTAKKVLDLLDSEAPDFYKLVGVTHLVMDPTSSRSQGRLRMASASASASEPDPKFDPISAGFLMLMNEVVNGVLEMPAHLRALLDHFHACTLKIMNTWDDFASERIDLSTFKCHEIFQDIYRRTVETDEKYGAHVFFREPMLVHVDDGNWRIKPAHQAKRHAAVLVDEAELNSMEF